MAGRRSDPPRPRLSEPAAAVNQRVRAPGSMPLVGHVSDARKCRPASQHARDPQFSPARHQEIGEECTYSRRVVGVDGVARESSRAR